MKVWIIIHSRAHLNRFRVLTMLLLLWVPHLWKHVFNTRIVCRLDQHTCLIIFIYTAVSDMSDIDICSHSCLFHTIGHVESLLTCICSGPCRDITLNVSHVQNPTIWWLWVIHSDAARLSWKMLWFWLDTNKRACSRFCLRFGFYHTHIY